ncbi:MAG: histone deacetylase [Desulfobacterales bacterium]|nr:histone deacetylase [Desulfobacterales bacterium]
MFKYFFNVPTAIKQLFYSLATRYISPIFFAVSKPRSGNALYNQIAIIYHRNYQVYLYGLEGLHLFDTHRYARIYSSLVRQRVVRPNDVFVPNPVSDKDILRIHSDDFLNSLSDPKAIAQYLEAPWIEFFNKQWLENLILPFRYATGGTILAAELALTYGLAINMGGGFHHAKPQNGEGFCIFADIPIAIKKLQSDGKIQKTLIVDLDVHQGNGTVVCLSDDLESFTFSMHQRHIYPTPKEISDFDIELDAGTDDTLYMQLLSEHLPRLFNLVSPDMVFYIAGCDTLFDDPLASLALTQEGIIKRDFMVFQECKQRHIPLVITLGGGYGPSAPEVQTRSIQHIIEYIKQENMKTPHLIEYKNL